MKGGLDTLNFFALALCARLLTKGHAISGLCLTLIVYLFINFLDSKDVSVLSQGTSLKTFFFWENIYKNKEYKSNTNGFG